jgi:hypothetical protein
VTEALAALEATALAQHMKAARWTYPLVNAGHVAGIALLLGAVVPMHLRTLGWVRGPEPAAVAAFLRPFAVAGLLLAAGCGALLFITQAGDYAANFWFRLKLGLLALALALANAAWHLRAPPSRGAAALSLALWPLVLISGRMIGFS